MSVVIIGGSLIYKRLQRSKLFGPMLPEIPLLMSKHEKAARKQRKAEEKQAMALASFKSTSQYMLGHIVDTHIANSDIYKESLKGEFSLSYNDVQIKGSWEKNKFPEKFDYIPMVVSFDYNDAIRENVHFKPMRLNDTPPVMRVDRAVTNYKTTAVDLTQSKYNAQGRDSRMNVGLKQVLWALDCGEAKFEFKPT